ncbi:hypothetical protein B566_EDAN018109 [Ephemera danica]|nr:hypothetical protein B566_EDAN018109 [Ephemera danica]
MYQIAAVINETDGWWNDAEEVLAPGLPLASLGNELLSFVPPPPRPSLFMLEELGSEAFTATCDLSGSKQAIQRKRTTAAPPRHPLVPNFTLPQTTQARHRRYQNQEDLREEVEDSGATGCGIDALEGPP